MFLDHKDEDYDEFGARFDNIRMELDDVEEVFSLVRHTVADTPTEPFLLSIMQHLLVIR